MKRVLSKIAYRMALATGWRWMMFVAGVSLLTATQSCRIATHKCYEAVPVDTTEAVQPTCYEMPAPVAPAQELDVIVPKLDDVQ